MKIKYLFTLFIAFVITANVSAQQDDSEAFKIGYTVFEPFAFIDESGNLSGFDIEYWERYLSKAIGVSNYEFVELPNMKAKLKAVQDGSVDMALGGISITSTREKTLDFSTGYFDSGLGILCHNSGEKGLAVMAFVKSAFSPVFIVPFLLFTFFIIVGGLVMWWSELGSGEAINDNFIPGIFEGMWCAFATATTIGYGDIAPKKWLGRLVTAPIALAGFFVLASFMGSFSSTMTLARMENTSIKAPEDLRGKTVVTKRGTTSTDSMKKYGAYVIEVDKLSEAYSIVSSGSAKAVVADEPNLKYFLKNDKSGDFYLVDEVFDIQDYGFAFAENSTFTEAVSIAHLTHLENGNYSNLYDAYFKK